MTDTISQGPGSATGHTGGLPRPVGCHRVRPAAELEQAARQAESKIGARLGAR